MNAAVYWCPNYHALLNEMADWCVNTKYTIYLQYPTDLPVNHQSTDNNAQYKQTSTIITNIYINDCNTIIITEGSQSHS